MTNILLQKCQQQHRNFGHGQSLFETLPYSFLLYKCPKSAVLHCKRTHQSKIFLFNKVLLLISQNQEGK